MTVDERLQEMVRRAEETQRPITVEEIVARASSQDDTRFLKSPRTPTRRRSQNWLLTAAAVIVVVAAIALLAIDADDDADSARVVTDPSTTSSTNSPALARFDGTIAFAADAGAGEALTDPVDRSRIEIAPGPMDIYLARAGEPARRLASSGAHERCPTFSPDGERLAYLSVPPGPRTNPADGGTPLDATLVVLELDGTVDPTDPELVVPFAAPSGYQVRLGAGNPCPRWSSDGKRVAYLAEPVASPGEYPDVAELRVVTLDGQERVVAELTSAFAWSSSGDDIVFLKAGAVWVTTLDGRKPSLLWQPEGFATAVSWSSRGELAVIVRTEVAVAGGYREEFVVHVVDGEGASTPLGAVNVMQDMSVSWSPDGTRLAFVRGDQIVLHDRDDGSTALLSPPVVDDRAVGFLDVEWTPGGEHLLVLAHAVQARFWEEDWDFMEARGMALLSLSTDGTLIDVLTPWSWAFDWTSLDDVSSYPSG